MMNKRCKRGFSLIEIIIVLALASVILFCVAQLTQTTLGTLKFLQKKSISVQGATLGCERLASELRESVEIVDLSSDLVFRKVNPAAATAVGNPMAQDPPPAVAPPPPAPPLWVRAYPAAQLALIRYQVDDSNPDARTLQRSVNGGLPMTVARNLNTFAVSKEPNVERTHRVRLSISEGKRTRVFTLLVYSPGLPE